ncbi:uncharacterized protein METZ01_LOCUS147204, partial [marine metagenome]
RYNRQPGYPGGAYPLGPGFCTTHLLGARRPDGIASRIDV